MIPDRTFSFSVTVMFAWLMWAVVAALLTLGLVHESVRLMAVSLACSAAAATIHIRSFICTFSSRLKAAFDLGREVEREHLREKSLRSV